MGYDTYRGVQLVFCLFESISSLKQLRGSMSLFFLVYIYFRITGMCRSLQTLVGVVLAHVLRNRASGDFYYGGP